MTIKQSDHPAEQICAKERLWRLLKTMLGKGLLNVTLDRGAMIVYCRPNVAVRVPPQFENYQVHTRSCDAGPDFTAAR